MKIGIFHTAFIGDIVLCGLLIEALHKAGHEIVFFTKPHTTAIYKQDVRVKKTIAIEKKSGLKKWIAIKAIAKQIENEKCHVLLVPHKSATSALCAKLSKTPVTIGFKNSSLSLLYKITVPFSKEKHECVRYLAFATANLVHHSILSECERVGRPILRYSEKSFALFQDKFKNLSLCQQDFFVIAPGSVWATKKYPAASWAQVAVQYLTRHPHFYCALCGSASDQQDILDLKLEFERQIKGLSLKEASHLRLRLVDTSTLFDLSEFAMFISKAKFVLSNDSSPTHFASAFDIPTVTIFGPTVPAFGFAPTSTRHASVVFLDSQNKPISCQPCSIHGQNKCPLGHHRCMKDLDPNVVFEQIESLLS